MKTRNIEWDEELIARLSKAANKDPYYLKRMIIKLQIDMDNSNKQKMRGCKTLCQ